MIKYTLKVQEIRRETEDAVTLCFKQPGLRKIKYRAGQYLTLQLSINGRKYSRPYSLSSAPAVDALLETTIKRVPNGIVSNYILDQIQIGDVIEVTEPMGDFVFDNQEGVETIYFWGVGSGITPLLSLIKEILYTKPLIRLHLVYGNRNFRSTLFSDLLNELVQSHPDNFTFTQFHTRAEMNEDRLFVKKGRIHKEFISDLVQQADVIKTRHYICGPADLKKTIKEVLGFYKYPAATIFSEDFELVKDPKDFEDLRNRSIRIHFEGKDHQVAVSKGRSVLEAALDAGNELPYSCQTGNCSSCKGKLKTGELRMIGPGKERTDLLPDEYLLCCSFPLTDTVSIEI